MMRSFCEPTPKAGLISRRDELKELNLVAEADLGEGRVRYHITEKGHHHHLVCRSCGKIMDPEESVLHPLEDTLLQRYGFNADLRHLAISGECEGCREKKGGKA